MKDRMFWNLIQLEQKWQMLITVELDDGYAKQMFEKVPN